MSASDEVGSGRLSLSVALALDGIKQLDAKPITLALSGPFARVQGRLETDLTATVTAASSSADLGLDLVGGRAYLGLGGTFYELGATRSSATGATGLQLGASGAGGLLAGLHIDPRTWLTDPHNLGAATVGGVATDHLRAEINVANVLGDLSKVMASSGATGATGAGGASSVTSLLPLLESAITQAQVDIYTGVADHIVRRFELVLAFSVPPIAAGAVDGLTGGSLRVDATLTDVNQTETITAPASVQPASKLLNGVFALESRFGSLASLVSGLTSAGGGEASASSAGTAAG